MPPPNPPRISTSSISSLGSSYWDGPRDREWESVLSGGTIDWDGKGTATTGGSVLSEAESARPESTTLGVAMGRLGLGSGSVVRHDDGTSLGRQYNKGQNSENRKGRQKQKERAREREKERLKGTLLPAPELPSRAPTPVPNPLRLKKPRKATTINGSSHPEKAIKKTIDIDIDISDPEAGANDKPPIPPPKSPLRALRMGGGKYHPKGTYPSSDNESLLSLGLECGKGLGIEFEKLKEILGGSETASEVFRPSQAESVHSGQTESRIAHRNRALEMLTVGEPVNRLGNRPIEKTLIPPPEEEPPRHVPWPRDSDEELKSKYKSGRKGNFVPYPITARLSPVAEKGRKDLDDDPQRGGHASPMPNLVSKFSSSSYLSSPISPSSSGYPASSLLSTAPAPAHASLLPKPLKVSSKRQKHQIPSPSSAYSLFPKPPTTQPAPLPPRPPRSSPAPLTTESPSLTNHQPPPEAARLDRTLAYATQLRVSQFGDPDSASEIYPSSAWGAGIASTVGGYSYRSPSERAFEISHGRRGSFTYTEGYGNGYPHPLQQQHQHQQYPQYNAEIEARMAGLAFSDPLERLARRKHHQRVLLFKERAKNINQLASVQREDILTDQTMTEAEKVSACKEVDEDVRRAVLRAKRECGFDYIDDETAMQVAMDGQPRITPVIANTQINRSEQSNFAPVASIDAVVSEARQDIPQPPAPSKTSVSAVAPRKQKTPSKSSKAGKGFWKGVKVALSIPTDEELKSSSRRRRPPPARPEAGSLSVDPITHAATESVADKGKGKAAAERNESRAPSSRLGSSRNGETVAGKSKNQAKSLEPGCSSTKSEGSGSSRRMSSMKSTLASAAATVWPQLQAEDYGSALNAFVARTL